jgi:flagellar export protein FliJ
MAFHFTLNGLLRLRESLERAELQRLHSIAGIAALARAEIESLEKIMEEAHRRAFDTVVAAGLTGAELHFEIAKDAAWNVQRSQLLKKLIELEQKRKDQQSRYLHARMQREILSNLRDRQLADYEIDQSRRVQQRIDELFLIRGIPAAKQPKPASNEESE